MLYSIFLDTQARKSLDWSCCVGYVHLVPRKEGHSVTTATRDGFYCKLDCMDMCCSLKHTECENSELWMDGHSLNSRGGILNIQCTPEIEVVQGNGEQLIGRQRKLFQHEKTNRELEFLHTLC